MREPAATALKSVRLTFKPVTKSTRDDFVALFESPSAPKYCWCMVWRVTKDEIKTPGPKRKPFMMARIERGEPVGILGYDAGTPVAWASIAPKETFRKGLGGPPTGDGEKIWSLVCMFLRKDHRGAGIAHQLVDAAVREARTRGATIVEAYPVDPDSPSYRFMGLVPAFAKAGFEAVGRQGTRRHVMRLTL